MHKQLKDYLRSRSHAERILLLADMKKERASVPIALTEDLLCLDLRHEEKSLLLALGERSDTLAYEDFLTRGVANWEQNLAATALKLWRKTTEHQLWRRLLPLASDDRTPQRVLYTLLDLCWFAGGRQMLLALRPALAKGNLSEPTLAIVFRRFLQWDIEDEELMHIAEKTALQALASPYPRSASLIFAIEYLGRYRREQLFNLVSGPVVPEGWADVLQTMQQAPYALPATTAALTTLIAKQSLANQAFYLELYRQWPPVWMRHELTADTTLATLREILRRGLPQDSACAGTAPLTWEFFAGVAAKTLQKVVPKDKDPASAGAAKLLGWLLPLDTVKNSSFKSLSGREPSADQASPAPLAIDDPGRRAFFDVMYRSQVVDPKPVASPWGDLLRASDGSGDAGEADRQGRKLTGIFLQCFLHAVAKMPGKIAFLPGIVAHTRSTEAAELQALSQAFLGLGGAEGLGQVVHMLELANVGSDLKISICQALHGVDLTQFQARLRQIIREALGNFTSIRAEDFEVVEAIQALLMPLTAANDPALAAQNLAQAGGPGPGTSVEELESVPRALIKDFDALPADVKRILRTARLILHTVKSNAAQGSIDTSPAVDMQYKALEVLFRLRFEGEVLRFVESGVPRQRMDVLGSARPAKNLTDAFENYITSFDTVRDIPGFSRFKLQQIMKAIAAYRQGRRFTLDGLKAFALFFLVFARRECRYGLSGVFPLAFTDDKELFEFVRNLHVLQDVRNRAVHEGLPATELKAVEALWHLTGALINKVQLL